jgi:hypothetical protein
VRALVRVVLDAEQVIAELIGQARCLHYAVGIVCVRAQEVPELDLVSVVGNRSALLGGRGGTKSLSTQLTKS